MNDPRIKQQVATQQQLIQARQAAIAADLRGLEENMQGLKEQLGSYQNVLVQRRNQLSLLTEELNNTRAMVKDCRVYTSPSPRDRTRFRMPSCA